MFAFSQKEDLEMESFNDDATKQKFIGVFLWVIGFFLALIFGDNRRVAALSLLLHALSLVEYFILKLNSKDSLNNPFAMLANEKLDS